MGVEDYDLFDLDVTTQRMNALIASRNYPSAPLEPSYLMHPLDTKHQVFPTNSRTNTSAYRNDSTGVGKPVFVCSEVFVPPTNARPPWSGYVNNVDMETALQHRTYAAQRVCDQSEYVPPADSQLYTPESWPYRAVPSTRTQKLYERSAEDTDDQIARTKNLWNAQSRLEFHEEHDFYREYGKSI